jgi:CubicO group peptidase (beta-lactamase class C family)
MTNFAETLTPYFQALEQQNKFSGVVLITRGDETLYSAAYGEASRPWHIKNTTDTRFDTASITKLFTMVATLQLIERGLLTFETSVIDYLGLEDTTISRDVNVFHLLTHSSGIADDADEEAGEAYEDLWVTKANYSVMETVDFLPQFVHKPPNFAPGEGCRYCNVSFVLLGLMIEKAAGTNYRDYVREHIFARAGMTHSDFFRMDRVNENVAEGADPLRDDDKNIIGWKKNIYSYPPIGSPDGGSHVTIGDLHRFFRALQNGDLLSAELTQALFIPHVLHSDREETILRVGYCWEFMMNKADELQYFEKEGYNVGVSGVIRHYPTQNITVIILSNMAEGAWDPRKKIHELIS